MYLSRDAFFKLRIETVQNKASLYNLLSEYGHEPRSEDRSMNMSCCFQASHGKAGTDNKPSARYYPAGERDDDHETYYCWVCTERSLDAIGFTMRARGFVFMEALRYLERRYHIRYDHVELAEDINKVLEEYGTRKVVQDPSKLFKYCESGLRENRERIGMKRFTRLSYALDMIYHKDDKDLPDATVARLVKWRAALGKVLGNTNA